MFILHLKYDKYYNGNTVIMWEPCEKNEMCDGNTVITCKHTHDTKRDK